MHQTLKYIEEYRSFGLVHSTLFLDILWVIIMPTNFDIEDKVIALPGAASDIGLQTAEE
jgi:hypothetical protein